MTLFAVFPFYQYYVDPDATAYLTLARRYNEGDYSRAVNGYWSPWSIWLTALGMRSGLEPFRAAILVNSLGAAGFLTVSYSLFRRFRLRKLFQFAFLAALTLFLVYAVFWQSFDDLWECFFLLCVVRLQLTDRFPDRPVLWIVAGVAGALAYLAKAYALPFFMLSMTAGNYWLMRKGRGQPDWLWFKISLISAASMIVTASPWLYLLYQKYGFLTTGTAGSLNLSWYLVGHPYWAEGIGVLLPPPYPDSPSYWEDPWLVNGPLPHFWDSPRLFLLQVVKLGYNVLKFVQSSLELSAFFLLAVLLAVLNLRRDSKGEGRDAGLLSLCFLLFPLGYFLVNFQARYLWYMVPLCMVILAQWIDRQAWYCSLGQVHRRLIVLFLAFSFAAYPVLGLKEMYRVGEREHQLAVRLRQLGIRGSFTTNIPFGPQSQHINRLAYFSGNPYLQMPVPADKSSFFSDVRRYRVKYYFHFVSTEWDDFDLRDERGIPVPELVPGQVPGLRVFDLGGR